MSVQELNVTEIQRILQDATYIKVSEEEYSLSYKISSIDQKILIAKHKIDCNDTEIKKYKSAQKNLLNIENLKKEEFDRKIMDLENQNIKFSGDLQDLAKEKEIILEKESFFKKNEHLLKKYKIIKKEVLNQRNDKGFPFVIPFSLHGNNFEISFSYKNIWKITDDSSGGTTFENFMKKEIDNFDNNIIWSISMPDIFKKYYSDVSNLYFFKQNFTKFFKCNEYDLRLLFPLFYKDYKDHSSHAQMYGASSKVSFKVDFLLQNKFSNEICAPIKKSIEQAREYFGENIFIICEPDNMYIQMNTTKTHKTKKSFLVVGCKEEDLCNLYLINSFKS
ncbi:MAG: hypothetical protein ACI9AR_000020 [Flavobacteriaceae bacterium]|jgi:hypothetical protein